MNVAAISFSAVFNGSSERGADIASFDTNGRSRVAVLAGIIGLHVILVICIVTFRATPRISPEVPTVLMTQLIAEPAVAPSAPPKPMPAVPSPVTAVVRKPTPRPLAKPIARPAPEAAVNAKIDTPLMTEANVTPAPVMAAPSPPSITAAAQPAPLVQAVATTPPRYNASYLNNPPPNYPMMARRLGEEGRVMLRVFVTPEGSPGEVRIHISSGSPLFDDAAIAAVKQWHFVPARQGDNAIAAWVQVPIVFRLT